MPATSISKQSNKVIVPLAQQVVALTALLFVLFHPSIAAANVNSNCGIAAGGSVTAEEIQIKCGLSDDIVAKLVEAAASGTATALGKQIGELSVKLNIREQAIAGFLESIKRENVPDDKLGDTFRRIAQDYIRLLNDRQAITTGDTESIELLKQADAAIESGDVRTAKELLSRVTDLRKQRRKQRDDLRAAYDQADLDDAAVEARAGQVSLTELDYLAAAMSFRRAAEIVPPGHWREKGEYIREAANARFNYGDQKTDNGALSAALEDYRLTITEFTKERSAGDWATAHSNIATTLLTLGEREGNVLRFEEAVVAYEAALSVFTRDQFPKQWGRTQSNLGAALQLLGTQETGTEKLKLAVTALKNALQELPRSEMRVQWATAQNNLGAVMNTIGQRDKDVQWFISSVEALRSALSVLTKEGEPLQWATAKDTLGSGLQRLGVETRDVSILREAVRAHEDALRILESGQFPLRSAIAQNNLAFALYNLGSQAGDPKILERSIEVFRKTLDKLKRESTPLHWGIVQGNLGSALFALGSKRQGITELDLALEAFNLSLQTVTSNNRPVEHKKFQDQLNATIQLRAERSRN
jgi:tetratricopeptide (TPR) repeat protein